MAEWPRYYILKDRVAVAVDDVMTWGRWFENFENRKVADTVVGRCNVSTVFLGLDHSFRLDDGDSEPVLFETMIFGGPLNGEQWRYCTYEQAERGHEEAVKRARQYPWWRWLLWLLTGKT